MDDGLEFLVALKHAAPDALAGDSGKEALLPAPNARLRFVSTPHDRYRTQDDPIRLALNIARFDELT